MENSSITEINQKVGCFNASPKLRCFRGGGGFLLTKEIWPSSSPSSFMATLTSYPLENFRDDTRAQLASIMQPYSHASALSIRGTARVTSDSGGYMYASF